MFDPFIGNQVTISHREIIEQVQYFLDEDLQTGDLTAELVDAERTVTAVLHVRESAMICGQSWFEACFHSLDAAVQIAWHAREGEWIESPQIIAEITGPARTLLTAERTALNLLQTLSGTASMTAKRVAELHATGSPSRLLDTRKTIPGLRKAQKYAVRCGGGYNHRIGLWDALLIKENHIRACGSITRAVSLARTLGQGKWIEVETETLAEVDEAIEAGADVIMLDNFDLQTLHAAVRMVDGKAISEASGGIDENTLRAVAATGVDYISSGSLTKNLQAIDFSLRFV